MYLYVTTDHPGIAHQFIAQTRFKKVIIGTKSRVYIPIYYLPLFSPKNKNKSFTFQRKIISKLYFKLYQKKTHGPYTPLVYALTRVVKQRYYYNNIAIAIWIDSQWPF